MTDLQRHLEQFQWGRLPFDLFALEKWNSSSAEDDEAQRTRLAFEYVNMGCLGRSVYYGAIQEKRFANPTQSQIDNILRPWQTDHQRMLSLFNNSFVWLRTCYKPGSDDLHVKLLSSLAPRDLAEVVGSSDNVSYVLDDSSLYDYGSDWLRIFVRIPELPQGYGPRGESAVTGYHKAIREAQVEAIREFGEDEIEDLEEPDYTDMQSRCVTNFFFVEDEESLHTGKVLIVWLDECGRTIRQCRILPADASDVVGIQYSPGLFECLPQWLDGEVGAAYLTGGICGPPYAPD